jgi:4-amino-4-deoxy-L-arabinose transferase-like glycosyltransferase
VKPDRRGPPPGLLLGLIVAVALVARLVFVAVTPPVLIFPDGREYAAVARSLLEGHGFGAQTLRPPGYPAFIALVWALTGRSLVALRIVEAVLGALTVALIGQFGMGWFGRRAGLLAAALAALHPVLAFLPATQYSENLIVLVCVLGYGALLGATRDPRAGLGRWALGGMLFGLAALIRPNVVLLVPGLLAGATWSLAHRGRATVRPVLLALVALALTIAPWIVYEHQREGHWFFIATGGGRSLWLGSNDRTTGHAGSIVVPDSALAAELMKLPDEVVRDRRLASLAFQWMRADPARAVRMYGIRLSSLWALYPDPYTRMRQMNGAARAAQAVFSLVIFAGALIALRRARGNPLLAPMTWSIVVFSLVNALFFMVLRYRLPFEPMLIWMAGIGWLGAAPYPPEGV